MPGTMTSVRELSTGSRLLMVLLVASYGGIALCAARPVWWEGFLASVLGAGVLVVLSWRREDIQTQHVLLLALLFRLSVFWLPPVLSDDVYRYIWDGLLQAYGLNPYRYVPEAEVLAAFHGESLFGKLNSTGYYSVYPPLSQYIFALGGAVYDAGWETSYYVIKGVFVAFELTGMLLLSRMVSAGALLLYAWHPLVVVEVAGQAHTEAVMVGLLLLCLWLVRRGNGSWATLALTAAGWVKLYPFVLLPFLWRRYGWKAVAVSVIASIIIALPYAAAYVPGHMRASLELYVRYFEFNAGFYYGVKEVLLYLTGEDWSKTLGPWLRTVFLLLLPVLYVADARRGWSVERAFIVTLGAFLLLATTVHPWYLLAVLPLAVMGPRPAWHWIWLGCASAGTYLLYVDGAYWLWVVLGWSGWLVLAAARHRRRIARAADAALQAFQRWRSRRKARWIRALVPSSSDQLRILDLGAGEGYVGEALARQLGGCLVLADVVNFNRTAQPLIVYDGRKLPFEDDAFDLTLLYFVLHHAEDAEQVLREALRVTRGRVVVVESTYKTEGERRRLAVLDRIANRLRSGGRMRAQEAHLHFRSAAAWRVAIEGFGGRIVAEQHRGRLVHRQVAFVVAP